MPYRFLNPDEAAQYLNLRQADLERLIKDREIPFETRGHRTVFRRQDLDEWASQRILSANPKRLAAYHKETSERTRARLQHAALLPDLIQLDQIDAAMTAKT